MDLTVVIALIAAASALAGVFITNRANYRSTERAAAHARQMRELEMAEERRAAYREKAAEVYANLATIGTNLIGRLKETPGPDEAAIHRRARAVIVKEIDDHLGAYRVWLDDRTLASLTALGEACERSDEPKVVQV